MEAIVNTPLVTYKDAEEVIYGGKANPISVESEDEDDTVDAGVATPIPVATTVVPESTEQVKQVVPAPTEQVKQVLADVVQQEGFVIISDVLSMPSDNGWWETIGKDLKKLYNTNNNVTIFNGRHKNDNQRTQMVFSEFDITKKYPGVGRRKRSDPEALKRVETFTEEWFQQMEHQVKRLGLLTSPRTRGENKILVSYPPCERQKIHWDFKPSIVSDLIDAEKFEGVPISCICSFTPTGSSLLIRDVKTGATKVQQLKFGDLILFTGTDPNNHAFILS